MARFLAKSIFNEPTRPIMKTMVPGAKSIAALKLLDELQDTRTCFFSSDLQGSIGNYVKDADGNMLLDCHNQIASLALGYNNPDLAEAVTSKLAVSMLVNRPALGIDPPLEWRDMLEPLMRIAPAGMDQVVTSMCGSCANEMAFKAAFMFDAKKRRGGASFSAEDLDSCMANAPPGSPEVSILSFKGAFHGRLFGCLSTTRSKAIHKVDIPAYPWPAAPFPLLKYPLDKFAAENAKEEASCLEATLNLIKTWPRRVVAMIVEPIQAEGGDNHASPDFFRQLRQIALENDVLFIADEVQTAFATGRMWAHEQWQLSVPPDMVTFSKKMQIAGFYTRKLEDDSFRPSAAYRQFNTWMGSPIAVILLKAIVEQVQKHRLLENVTAVGGAIQQNLSSTPRLHNVRGKGTFIAFDLATPELRDSFVSHARNLGVNLAGCGDRTVRLRPMLVFDHSHADILNQVFHQVANKI